MFTQSAVLYFMCKYYTSSKNLLIFVVAWGCAIRIDLWSGRRVLPLSQVVRQVFPVLVWSPSPSSDQVSADYGLDLFTGEL